MSRRVQIHRQHPATHQGGFTLIEVLVATLVLLVGVLGVVGMQMLSLQANQGAMIRSQATFMASELLDAMRANPSAAEDYVGDYPADLPAAPPACAVAVAGCAPTDAADYDLYTWGVQLQAPDPNDPDGYQPAIPGATVSVDTTANADEYSIVVSWNERGFDEVTEDSSDRADVTRTVTLTSVVVP